MREQTRNKMSLAHQGKKHTLETKRKISLAMRQYWAEVRESNALLRAAGYAPKIRKHSPETLAKMRAAAKGRQFSPQAQAAMRSYQQERKLNSQLQKQLRRQKKGL